MGWYCISCMAPARPGSIQAGTGSDTSRYATGVCSGEHQYARVDPGARRDPKGKDVPTTPLRRIGMVFMADPPAPREAHAADAGRYPPPAARSLWDDER